MAATGCRVCGRTMGRWGLWGHLFYWHRRAWEHLETCADFAEELGFGPDGEPAGDADE